MADLKEEINLETLAQYTNKPLRGTLSRHLVPVLRNYLRGRLPEYMVPSAFVVLDELPRTPGGKVDRRALPAPARHADRPHVPPRDEAERRMAAIWAEVLGRERVSVEDDFFELGGDSILSILITSRAREAGLAVTLREVFEHPTVAGLAGVARRAHATAGRAVAGEVPLLPIQRWFFEQPSAGWTHFNQGVLLRPRLDVDSQLLRRAVAALMEHHEALRLRFVRDENADGGWRQSIVEPQEAEAQAWWSQEEIAATVSDQQRRARIEQLAEQCQGSLDPRRGPLWRALHIRVRGEAEGAAAAEDDGDETAQAARRTQTAPPSQDERLLVVIHHLAVDGVSWRILLRDLELAYRMLAAGEKVRLPANSATLRDWAEALQDYSQSEVVGRQSGYWTSPARETVGRLPVDHRGENSRRSVEAVAVKLSLEETQELLQVAGPAYRAGAQELLMTAVAGSLWNWCGADRLLIDIEGHGREEIAAGVDVSRTVGWLAALYPLLLERSGRGGVGEELEHIKEQMRKTPDAGRGYGLLRYLRGDEELAERLRQLPQPEVFFNYLGQLDQTLPEDSLFELAPENSGPAQSGDRPRRHLLEINAVVAGHRLQVEWVYSRNVHDRATIEAVAEEFRQRLAQLISWRPSAQVEAYTPADFPDVELSRERLGDIIAELDGDE